MSYTYEQRKRPQGQQNSPLPEQTSAPGPAMAALMNGAATPTAAQKGRPIDLDGAMKAKMEHAFGDLSNLKLYESRAVGEAGAQAIAQGNEIAFAPGMADFSSRSGQERLGHELSHVMSQRSGQVRGQGFLASAALEARADREGAMAAAGQQVYTGPVTHAISDASPSPAVAGPMQANRDEDRWKASGKASANKLSEAMALPDDNKDSFQQRPWHISEKQLQKNRFNPTGSKELAIQQAQIDAATSPRDAYNLFSALVGTGTGRLKHKDGTPWDPTDVDPEKFKGKLKNMLRMVHDYPELKGKVGSMMEENDHGAAMATTSTDGGINQATITYNSSNDKMGFFGSIKRFFRGWFDKKAGHSAAEEEYDGTHELGHVLNSLLLDPNDRDAAEEDWENNTTANEIVSNVLTTGEKDPISHQKLLKDPNSLVKHRATNKNKGIVAGQIDLKKSGLKKKGMTSGYGEANAAEFFAEAFADVYNHGNKARPASIALVKEYEERRKKIPPKQKKAKAPAQQEPKQSLNLIHDEDQPEFLIHNDEPMDLLGSKSDSQNLIINTNSRASKPAPKPAPKAEPLDNSDPESGVLTMNQKKIDHTKDLTVNYLKDDKAEERGKKRRPDMVEAGERIESKLKKKYGKYYGLDLKRPANPGEKEGVNISGLNASRLFGMLLTDRGRGFNMGEDEIYELMDDLHAPHKQGMTPEEQKQANDRFDGAMQKYKGILLDDLKDREKKYGALMTQMHPEDTLPQIGEQAFGQDDGFLQDATQMRQMGGKYLDPEHNEEDQRFIDLSDYYNNTTVVLQQYKAIAHGGAQSGMEGVTPDMLLNETNKDLQEALEIEGRIKGPRMNQEQMNAYQKDLKKRAKKESYLKGRLFGRFKS